MTLPTIDALKLELAVCDERVTARETEVTNLIDHPATLWDETRSGFVLFLATVGIVGAAFAGHAAGWFIWVVASLGGLLTPAFAILTFVFTFDGVLNFMVRKEKLAVREEWADHARQRRDAVAHVLTALETDTVTTETLTELARAVNLDSVGDLDARRFRTAIGTAFAG